MWHAWLYSDLLQASKGEPLSSGLSTDDSFISASAVPHCEIKKIHESDQSLRHEVRWTLSWSIMFCDILLHGDLTLRKVRLRSICWSKVLKQIFIHTLFLSLCKRQVCPPKGSYIHKIGCGWFSYQLLDLKRVFVIYCYKQNDHCPAYHRGILHEVGMLRLMSLTYINQPSLPPCCFCFIVSISVFMALSAVFCSLNPPDNSPFSHSVLPVVLVLSTIYLFMKVSFSPDIIPSGWLGSKHQLTN